MHPNHPPNLVFLLEDRSMRVFLESFLPRILSHDFSYTLIHHEGKTDLIQSIPRKLRAWNTPGTYFIVLIDQDSRDCLELKQMLKELCQEAGRPETLIRIACRELESWFLADLQAVETNFQRHGLARLQNQRKYRNPDFLGSPSQELSKLLPGYGKVVGAQQLGAILQIENERSSSFLNFVRGLETFVLFIQHTHFLDSSGSVPD